MHKGKQNKGKMTYAGSGYPKEVRAEAPIGIIWKATTRASTFGKFLEERLEGKKQRPRLVIGYWSKTRYIYHSRSIIGDSLCSSKS